ncbi:7TM diverse intracellular signaling domain-containing protein [Belliella kenyensis]|uniref:histidine kinase n=1 Tax=Belliella kenyensis TaxID=1472724 RepID=A0ABV8EJM2_9BACT|nr:hybrid sensor histidine kinase/response regulator [Belliella kenyensis]MCH7403757.1 response regulator [Belliella kenyensis]MDN3604439.1 7TM diverse intracellular signaling domain-containing protein [Belliella kenyensis]
MIPNQNTSVFILILIAFLYSQNSNGQYQLKDDQFDNPISIFKYASITNVGSNNYDIYDFLKIEHNQDFIEIDGPNSNLGFTKDNHWLKFSMHNESSEKLQLFFETGRPITDLIEFYQISENGEIKKQINGDLEPFSRKSFNHRKMIFPIIIEPNANETFYIQYQSDGEVINLPLNLHSAKSLIQNSYFEQFVFGIFYGILILAGTIYSFFYFGIKEKSFILYSFYVFSVILLHLSLDGYFFQFITPSSGWLSRNAVLLGAAFSTLAFGRYVQAYTQVKKFSSWINKSFNYLHIAVLLLLTAITFFESKISLYYPLVNTLGVILLILILTTVYTSYKKNVNLDVFFSLGILFFFIGFFIFILNNFSLIPNSFVTENASKLGTGLEIIFLSISMANRIKLLKSEKEKMQNKALQHSIESNEIKSFFLSNISHELRTPLNAVIGLTKSIEGSTDSDDIKNDLKVIRYSSLGLLSAIDDILDYSKIERNELQLEERKIDFAALIREVRTIVENQTKNKNLKFIYEEINQPPKFILGDKSRIRQIFLNLLNNAVKFTHEGYVSLRIQSEVVDNKLHLDLMITDSGIGIQKAKLDRIFESFIQERIDDKRKFGGFGLGLGIVKALVKAYDGQISIESEQHKGTEVKVSLVFETPVEVTYPEIASEEQNCSLKGKNILIVEDNHVNQLVIKSILRKIPELSFNIANHGIHALELLKSDKFDLILMDLQMPEMDGYETTQAIRQGDAGEKYLNIPIIAVTADATNKAKNKAYEVGMDDYLTKPIDSDELLTKMNNSLQLVNIDLPKIF